MAEKIRILDENRLNNTIQLNQSQFIQVALDHILNSKEAKQIIFEETKACLVNNFDDEFTLNRLKPLKRSFSDTFDACQPYYSNVVAPKVFVTNSDAFRALISHQIIANADCQEQEQIIPQFIHHSVKRQPVCYIYLFVFYILNL